MSGKLARTLRDMKKGAGMPIGAMVAPAEVRFGLDITKVDVEQRLVEGWATSEIRDAQGDIIPYVTATEAFEKFASILGVREMHQPKAVGVLRQWWGDEEARKVGVQVYLSQSRDGEDALTKCREGVLKGFSLGGRAGDVDYDMAKRARIIKTMSLTEISLVDVPANPDARITLVKVEEISQDAQDGQDKALPDELVEKAIQDVPGIRHIKEGDLICCANCQHHREMGGVDYCWKFDSKVAADWVCGAWEKAGAHPDAVEISTGAIAVTVTAGDSSSSSSDSSDSSPSSSQVAPGLPSPVAAPMAMTDDPQPVAKAIPQTDPPVQAAGAPEQPVKEVPAGDVPDIDPTQGVMPVEQRIGKLEKAIENLAKEVVRLEKVKDEEKEKLEAELKARGQRVGISRKSGEPLTAPAGYPEDWALYGDPANWGWPADKGRASTAVGYYNGGKGKDKYSPREWNVLGRRIARIASEQTGAKYVFSAQDKRIEREEEKKMNTIEKGKDLAGILQSLKDQLSALSEVGVNPEDVKGALAQIMAGLEVAQDTARTFTEAPPVGTQASGVKEVAAGSTPVAAPAVGEPSSPPSTPGKMTPVGAESDTKYTEMCAKLDALTKAVEALKIGKAADVAPSQPPAGFIPPAAPGAAQDPIEKALVDGDLPTALAEANKRNLGVPFVYRKLDELARKELAKSGIGTQVYMA